LRSCKLPGGVDVPVLGLGTWRMGERPGQRGAEVSAIRAALSMGYRLIDTAEMYGEGAAESVIGEALGDASRSGELHREDVFLVSKVYPHNASRKGMAEACDRSRSRLGVDRIDLYLLHWRGQFPLHETCEAMLALCEQGRIGLWGVSNFDLQDMQELREVEKALGIAPASAHSCATNQIYYSVSARGSEFRLQPWQRTQGISLMAYSPIDQGALRAQPVLADIGKRHGATAAQVALAWVLRQEGVIAIPKAVGVPHLRENFASSSLVLTAEDLAQIDRDFPPPTRKSPLAVL